MKIAIAQFGARVSPRFDHAQAFVVVTLKDGEGPERRELWAKDLAPRERVTMLAGQSVGALICGGIDEMSAGQLTTLGIDVYSSITGGIEDALACFLRGELEQGMMMGNDGRCCGRWRSRAGARQIWGGAPGSADGEMGVQGNERGQGAGRGRSEGRGAGRSGRSCGRGQGQGRGRRGSREGGGSNASGR